MVEKQAILNKAFQKTSRDSGFVNLVQCFSSGLKSMEVKRANRTLFSALSAVTMAAPEDSLVCIRETLGMVDRIEDSQFLRTKTEHLKMLIKCILYDDSALLSDNEKGFKGYLKADLVAYIEICRRIFFVEQEKITREGKVKPAPPNLIKTEYSVPEQKRKPRWMNNPLDMAKELGKNNHECAKYILHHKNERKFSGLIIQAEKVLSGGDK